MWFRSDLLSGFICYSRRKRGIFVKFELSLCFSLYSIINGVTFGYNSLIPGKRPNSGMYSFCVCLLVVASVPHILELRIGKPKGHVLNCILQCLLELKIQKVR